MVSDSSISDDDRVWSGPKVFRVDNHLIGFAGLIHERIGFIQWWKGGMKGTKPRFAASQALVMGPGVLLSFAEDLVPYYVESGIEAIGSGSKAVMCAYEALGFQDPRRAVKIVCKHDAQSRLPVRSYKLKAV